MMVGESQQLGQFGLTLIVTDPVEAARFYREVFNAEEIRQYHAKGLRVVPDGTIISIELRLCDVALTVGMQNPYFQEGRWIDQRRADWPRSPAKAGTTTACFAIYVADVDETLEKALANGATLMHPQHVIQKAPSGERFISFFDPMGHVWRIMTRAHDVALEGLSGTDGKSSGLIPQ
jgi:PhnB protein